MWKLYYCFPVIWVICKIQCLLPFSCRDLYRSHRTFCVFQNDQVLQGFSVDKGEFTCPLCRQFANSVLPCRPGRGTEAGAWHAPTNKKICVLVKEVEDLQERLALFSVSSAAKRKQIEMRKITSVSVSDTVWKEVVDSLLVQSLTWDCLWKSLSVS